MERYFVKLAYDGTHLAGWQKQPNALTVQQIIEENFSKVLAQSIQVVGCGRTDAGVHAREYYMHFDSPENLTEATKHSLRSIQPKEIAIKSFISVPKEAHARYDARLRQYKYYISKEQDPFLLKYSWQMPNAVHRLNLESLNSAASIIASYSAFYPFCKAGAEVSHYNCEMFKAIWEETNAMFVFTIAANRFLRGMVRLIVGACTNYAEGKISLEELTHAMDSQSRLDTAYSVPGRALFLDKIEYDFISN